MCARPHRFRKFLLFCAFAWVAYAVVRHLSQQSEERQDHDNGRRAEPPTDFRQDQKSSITRLQDLKKEVESELETAAKTEVGPEISEEELISEQEAEVESEPTPGLEVEEIEEPAVQIITWVQPVDGGTCPTSHPIKARFSTGRYHLPEDDGYERVVADCCYESVEDAERDGFTHSRW